MKVFVALSVLLALAVAKPQILINQLPVGALIERSLPIQQQQYHAQDEFGQYSYGYSEPLSAKKEIKTLDGVTRGSYSYIDAENKLQTVDYVADGLGFRVAATNLPKPVQVPEIRPAELPLPVVETPEVAAARISHMAAIEDAKLRNLQTVQPVAEIVRADLPKPVEDTPEVAQAKLEHFRAIDEARLRTAGIRYATPALKTVAYPQFIYPNDGLLRTNLFPINYGLENPLFYNSRFLTSSVIAAN